MIRRRNKSYGNKSELPCNKCLREEGSDREGGCYVPKSRVTKKNIVLRYSDAKKYDIYERIYSDSILQKLREDIGEVPGDYYILDQPLPSHSSPGPRHTNEVILYILKPRVYLVWSLRDKGYHLYSGAEDKGRIGKEEILGLFKDSKRQARKSGDIGIVRYLTRLIKLIEEDTPKSKKINKD